jgi:hypothetical protein
MKACGGVVVYIHIFLTSTLIGGEWSALCLGRFNLGELAPGTHSIEGWVDPRDGVDDMEKRKFLTPYGLELRPSVVQPVASRYTDCYTVIVQRPVYISKDSVWETTFCPCLQKI